MIYLDTSVVLAQLLAEDVTPAPAVWRERLVTSRLTEYEVWTRLHSRGLGSSHGELARDLLQRLAFLELAPPVLARALEPFPGPVRTLDALHLASVAFLQSQRVTVSLASYDARMIDVGRRMGFPLASLL